ncbi:MAG: hypothetical protein ACI4QN_00610 [Candidatus Coproplasma sp.]
MRTQLKKVIRFYFSAGSLNSALDGIITRLAASSWQELRLGEHTFDKVNKVIEIKAELKTFWVRLNGVMAKLPTADLLALKKYASLRTGVMGLDAAERRIIHSALVKFKRRAGIVLISCKKGYECVCAYYALISPNPD